MTPKFKFNITGEVKCLFPEISDDWITIYKDVEKIVYSCEEILNFKSLVVAGLCRVLGENIKNQLRLFSGLCEDLNKLGNGVWDGELQKHTKRINLYLPNDPQEANEIWIDWNEKTKFLLEKIKKECSIFYPNLIMKVQLNRTLI